jgi:hypothetical protein
MTMSVLSPIIHVFKTLLEVAQACKYSLAKQPKIQGQKGQCLGML